MSDSIPICCRLIQRPKDFTNSWLTLQYIILFDNHLVKANFYQVTVFLIFIRFPWCYMHCNLEEVKDAYIEFYNNFYINPLCNHSNHVQGDILDPHSLFLLLLQEFISVGISVKARSTSILIKRYYQYLEKHNKWLMTNLKFFTLD